MMSNSERRDRLQVIIVFSGLWKKSTKMNSQDVQNKEAKSSVFTQCTSELWSLLPKDIVHDKRFVQVQNHERFILNLLNRIIRLLAEEVSSPSHRPLEAGGVLGYITACLFCPCALFPKPRVDCCFWRD